MRDQILSLVGLATKAGKVVAGEFSTEAAVKSGKAALVLISPEASKNTKKKFCNMCAFYEVPAWYYGTREQLGAFSGNEFRVTLAVQDVGFADAMLKKLPAVAKEATPETLEAKG